MMEMLAGVIVALAGLAWVLQPLARTRRDHPVEVAPGDLVRIMEARLQSRCLQCDTPAEPGSAFCSKCGSVLAGEE